MGLRRCVVLAGTSFNMSDEMSRRLRISGASAAAIAAFSYSLAKRAFALFTWCQKAGEVRNHMSNVSGIWQYLGQEEILGTACSAYFPSNVSVIEDLMKELVNMLNGCTWLRTR